MVGDDEVDPRFVEQMLTPMVDQFMSEHMVQLVGPCVAVKDSTTWCGSHDSLWMGPELTCRRVRDLDDFGCRAIIAWEATRGR